MIRKEKRAGKKYWILTVFAAFIAIAMSFVSWLIYAVFSQSYREIKQQYYGVVSRQIVEDIENSIRNGKQIERFYGMDKVLSDMLAIRAFGHVPGLDTDDRRASRDYAVLAASAPGLPPHEPETGVRGLHAYLSGGEFPVLLRFLAGAAHHIEILLRYRVRRN